MGCAVPPTATSAHSSAARSGHTRGGRDVDEDDHAVISSSARGRRPRVERRVAATRAIPRRTPPLLRLRQPRPRGLWAAHGAAFEHRRWSVPRSERGTPARARWGPEGRRSRRAGRADRAGDGSRRPELALSPMTSTVLPPCYCTRNFCGEGYSTTTVSVCMGATPIESSWLSRLAASHAPRPRPRRPHRRAAQLAATLRRLSRTASGPPDDRHPRRSFRAPAVPGAGDGRIVA